MQIHAEMTDEEPAPDDEPVSKNPKKEADWWRDPNVVRSKFLREKISKTCNSFRKKIKILTYNAQKKDDIILRQKTEIKKLRKKNKEKTEKILKLCGISESDWFCFS